MEELTQAQELLRSFGIELPTAAYFIGIVVFSVIGLFAFHLGRKRKRKRRAVMWIGVALMLYPYVVWGTVPMYAVGVALSAAAWWAWSRAAR
jgi:MFS family permease